MNCITEKNSILYIFGYIFFRKKTQVKIKNKNYETFKKQIEC